MIMATISYTIGNHIEDICVDILYEHKEQAVSEAKENGIKAYQFEWDGIDAQSIENITDISN
tara:strand:- start:289 stop:474 length:186 start_codon:yes stop_codon:yes gene_type:complete